MSEYVARARRLAERIRRERICEINPAAADVNAFQLLLPGTADALQARHREFAAREKVWLFNGFFESPLAVQTIAEIVIGEAADDYGDDQACDWLRRFQAP